MPKRLRLEFTDSDEEVTMQPGGDSDSSMDEDSDTSEASSFGAEVDAISDMKWVLLQMSMPIAIWIQLYEIHNYDSHVHMLPRQAHVPVYFYKNGV